ncbi:chemotaxis protein CheB [Pseudonocardia benzenivorans]|uniref:protein-glutamate methylesterase n=1 Tax=Pseudonocardia benzenivorans TaxID=228005 RepID=A0ABW3VLF9_9PSEU
MRTLPLVVVGGSAGGIEALLELAAGLPADLPAAVLVIVHTSQRPDTALARILARAGPLPAALADDGAPLRPGHILVAGPGRHLMTSRTGTVNLSAAPRVNQHRPAIDVLFASAARTHGPHVTAAVLSGALDDGAAGAALIARAGGRVTVQDPADARFSSMPRAVQRSVPDAVAARASTLGPVLADLAACMAHTEDIPMSEPRDTAPATGATAPAAGDLDLVRDDGTVPSRIVCPECSGALARIDLPHISYYRCHVGHQYGPQSLEAAQREAAEAKLWSAVAALEEHAALARHLTENMLDTVPPDYVTAAQHSADLAASLRERIVIATPTAPPDPE